MDEIPLDVAIDPFKLAEWMGWGSGNWTQAVFALPAGVTAHATIEVPVDEVWWVTYSIFGDIPSSCLYFYFRSQSEVPPKFGEDIANALIHEGWVGQPFCPPGWHRCEGPSAIHCTFQNVSGDSTYNDQPAQTLNIHCTLPYFMIKKKYVDQMDASIRKLVPRVVGGV